MVAFAACDEAGFMLINMLAEPATIPAGRNLAAADFLARSCATAGATAGAATSL